MSYISWTKSPSPKLISYHDQESHEQTALVLIDLWPSRYSIYCGPAVPGSNPTCCITSKVFSCQPLASTFTSLCMTIGIHCIVLGYHLDDPGHILRFSVCMDGRNSQESGLSYLHCLWTQTSYLMSEAVFWGSTHWQRYWHNYTWSQDNHRSSKFAWVSSLFREGLWVLIPFLTLFHAMRWGGGIQFSSSLVAWIQGHSLAATWITIMGRNTIEHLR